MAGIPDNPSMNLRMPNFLRPWLEQPISCSCGASHVPGVRRVVLAPGSITLMAEIFEEAGDAGPLLLVADPDTWDAAGARVARMLNSAGLRVFEAITARRPHADDAELERLRPALTRNPKRIVAVGSGTIGDLGKALAAEAGIPLMTVGTAASMNGYASSIVALTIGGLKITRPARCPDILLFDTDVLAAAPPHMTAAGFGDLASKPVSGADWVLSHRLLGEALCPAALSMTDAAASRARAAAADIGAGKPRAIGTLVEALVLSGVSMTIAGASSPASGGEHLLSHYLDISAVGSGAWRREPRLHGEQVAVGTLVSLALYRRIRETGVAAAREAVSKAGPVGEAVSKSGSGGEPVSKAGLGGEPVSKASAGGEAEETDEELARLHAHLPEAARAALLREAVRKRSRTPARSERLERLERDWDALWTDLDAQLAGTAGLASDLRAAGAPTRFSEIGVSRDLAVALILRARHMRDRFTVLDLAADLGLLKRWAVEIADELG